MERRTRGWGAKIKLDNQRGRHYPSSHPGRSPVQQIYHQASAQHAWSRHHIGGWQPSLWALFVFEGLKKKKHWQVQHSVLFFFFLLLREAEPQAWIEEQEPRLVHWHKLHWHRCKRRPTCIVYESRVTKRTEIRTRKHHSKTGKTDHIQGIVYVKRSDTRYSFYFLTLLLVNYS